VVRVVAPMNDPDPRVNGAGFAALRAAGVAVETGALTSEARRLNAGFLSRVERGRPWLTLKLAATLDGRIATESGESRWITGPAARARVHLMRAESDAILIGAGTARADDPALDVRLPGREERRPVRIVADARLSLPPRSRLAQTAAAAPLWLLHAPGADPTRAAALSAAGATLIETPAFAAGLDMAAGLRALGARGLTRVLCEGGGALAATLLRGGLADEIAWFSAGAAMGAEGAPALGPLGVERLTGMPRFRLRRVEALGPDLLSLWRRAD
jgi:diaminohydroxyphosphoribosylaminopyrimidine deaminase/5-amino-6-(5-phosphoribosylamino)uracil reductase